MGNFSEKVKLLERFLRGQREIMPTIVRRLDTENNGAVIPLDTRPAVKHRSQRTGYGQVQIAPAPAHFPIEQMHDSYGRRIHYLRISLTDACNLRCVYCMPENMTFRPRHELMSDEEILHLVKVGASLGVEKIRLTGGEPSIRPGVVELVRGIAAIPGIRDIAMTTNALLLAEQAQALADAGLRRVNISIDTLDADKFHSITRWGHIEDVWKGIYAAEAAGLTPIKLNAVVTRNFNDGQDVIDLARLTLERDWEVRFIEMMPFGEVSDFQRQTRTSYPLGKDPKGTLGIEFGVAGIPEKYFIGPDGRVLRKIVGPLDETRLKGVLEQLLAGK